MLKEGVDDQLMGERAIAAMRCAKPFPEQTGMGREEEDSRD
jgi:hypothetical protein